MVSIVPAAENTNFKSLRWFQKNYSLVSLLLFFLMVFLLLAVSPFQRPFTDDEFYYLLKASEINRGNWELYHSDAIGWPVLIAFFLKVLRVDSFLTAMIVARALSVLFSAGVMVLLAQMARKHFSDGAGWLAMFAFMLCPIIWMEAGNARTEPLFMFLTLWALRLALEKKNVTKNFAGAMILAAASYYVRPNGIFILPLLLFFFWYTRKEHGKSMLWILILAVLFFMAAALGLYFRYAAFGSPFDYGPNSRYFADTYSQVWNSELQTPGFLGYISSHSLSEIFTKFITEGFGLVFLYLAKNAGGVIMLLFISMLIFRFRKRTEKKYDLFLLVVVFYLLALSPVFQIYREPRHLIVLLPLLFLMTADFLWLRIKDHKLKWLWLLLFFVGQTAFFIPQWKNVSAKVSSSQLKLPRYTENWLPWLTENLKGSVVIYRDQELIRGYLIEKHPDWAKSPAIFAEKSGLILRADLKYSSMENFYSGLKKHGVKYFVWHSNTLEQFPFLRGIDKEEWKGRFTLAGNFFFDEKNVRIYIVE